MSQQCVLAIDQGTSSTKAMVIDQDHTIAAVASEPVHPSYGADGRVEVDPEQLWRSVLDSGRAAVAQSKRSIGAVALANQGETVLVWDRRTGDPLTPAVVWQDRRAEAVCERLRDAAGLVEGLSGLRLESYFAAPKMTWLREQGHRAGVVTTSDAWLLAKMTGAFVTDAATASRTALLNLDSVSWSAELVELFDLDPEGLPTIVDCDEVVGTTTSFGPEVPVVGVVVDQQAALFAEGCHQAGEAKCTYGTGAFVLANTGARPARSSTGLVACVAWQLGGRPTYCVDGQVYTVGSVVDWLAGLGIITGPEDLDRYAGSGLAGSEVFVPALAGLAAPYWAPHARGSLSGLGLASGRSEIVSAVLEGLAASVEVLCEAAGKDTGTPIRTLRVDGGLSRSRALMQRQADLMQRPVEVYSSPHATALGAAGLARLGIGWATTPQQAIPDPSADIETYVPKCSASEAAQRLEQWRRGVDLAIEMSRR